MDDTYFLQAATMYFLSLWKTYLGPLIAAGSGFSYIEMLLFNLGAALSSSVSVLFLTDLWVKKLQSKRKGFNKHLRKVLKIWKRYGKRGSAVLAPILIGIPTYAVIARRFKQSRRSILLEITIITFAWCSVIFVAGREGFLLLDAAI